MRDLLDRGRFQVVLGSLEQRADLRGPRGQPLAEQRTDDDVEHERAPERIQVDLRKVVGSPDVVGPRVSWERIRASTAASVRATIIGIHPFSRFRLNAACTDDRRRLCSAPSDTIIEPSPTTNPNTLNLWPQRNASVGIVNSSRSAAGSPTIAMRTGPKPSPHNGPQRSRSSSSAGAGSRNNCRR